MRSRVRRAYGRLQPEHAWADMVAWLLGIDRRILVVLLGLYFVPMVIAIVRGNQNALPISLLNLFYCWTVLGWISALVWGIAGAKASVGPASGEPAMKVCPFCSESIRLSAAKCGYCGFHLTSAIDAQAGLTTDREAQRLAKTRAKWRSVTSDQPL